MYGMDVKSLNLTNTEHQVFKEGLIFSCTELLRVVHVFSFPEKFRCIWRSMGIYSKCHQTITLVKAKKLQSKNYNQEITIKNKMATQHQVLPEVKNNLFPQKKSVMRVGLINIPFILTKVANSNPHSWCKEYLEKSFALVLYCSIEERCYVLHIQTEFGQNCLSREPVGDNALIPQIPKKERKKKSCFEAVEGLFSAFSACPSFQ